MPGRRPDRAFAALVLLAWLPVALFAMGCHEMWRDELHCWLVARDAPTPWAVVHARAYDGQPPLWYLVLWLVQRVTHDVRAMQALHVALAAGVVWVVASRAPFSRPLRAVLPFGYFTAYEYVAISRCYALALLLCVLLCVEHPRRFERRWPTALLLGALGLTTTVSTVVTLAWTGALALEGLGLWRRRDPRGRRAWIPVAAALASCAAAALCAWPPADSTVTHVGFPHAWPEDTAITRIVVAFVPIPPLSFFFWNNNALVGWEPFGRVAAWVAVGCVAWILFTLRSSRFAALVFGAGTVGLVVLFAFVYGGDVRHHGFFFVLLLMGAWIALQAGAGARSRAIEGTLGLVLALHVVALPVALYYDGRYVFSSGKRAADALRERGLEDALFVAEVDYPATAVLGQLGPAAIAFTPRTGRAFTFVKWTRDRHWDPTDAQTLAYAARLGAERGLDPVLIMNRPLLPELVDGVRVVRLAELYDSMIEEENFYLYRVTRAELVGPGEPLTR